MGVAKSTEWIGYRLLARISVSPAGCFNWKLSGDRKGYGQTGMAGGTRYAHILSYETFRGPVPPGLYVLHKCDNPRCINPAHLFLGTQLDNMRDCISKGRHAWGEKVPNARLKNSDVRQIAERYAAGEESTELAKSYGVRYAVIWKILTGKTYRGIERQVFVLEYGTPGQDHYAAKVTDADVRAMRAAVACGASRASQARKYGLTGTTVSKIVLGKAWKHLGAAAESG